LVSTSTDIFGHSRDPEDPHVPAPKRRRLGITFAVIGLLGLLVWCEASVSPIQSWFLSRYAEGLSYRLDEGPSAAIIFPTKGPFNVRRGYTRIPDFRNRLLTAGYVVKEQSRFSAQLLELAQFGISPPYNEAPVAGLQIQDVLGFPIYDTLADRQIYQNYEQIPPLLVDSLLFMEDRSLGDPQALRSNPVVNWLRFNKAVILYGASKLGLPVKKEGGSTLATQLEKYRYSASGRTSSVQDKLEQITSASLKVYSKGMDTRLARQRIVLDYINTAPLAGAPGYGEIYGLARGLKVWFGLNLWEVSSVLKSARRDYHTAGIYKQALSLLAAVKAPSFYLTQGFDALQRRVDGFVRLMAQQGVLDAHFAEKVLDTSISLSSLEYEPAERESGTRKAVDLIRSKLATTLGVPSFYDLDRLSLKVDSTIDAELQDEVSNFLVHMKDAGFLRQNGLIGRRLLSFSNPNKVIYSFVLYEATPYGNELRVHVDNHDQPFDVNKDMKLDLGSTAKLRTLVHYIDVVDRLYREYSVLDLKHLKIMAKNKNDPISVWAARTLLPNQQMPLDTFLDKALARKYSASPYEEFFTGGGTHKFSNFDKSDNLRRLSIRQATVKSTNLVFIRLMRDLVRYHMNRLPYDVNALLADTKHPLRRTFLEESADHEARLFLVKYHRKYSKLSESNIVIRLLGERSHSARHLSMLYFSWNTSAGDKDLADWLKRFDVKVSPKELARLVRKYGYAKYSLADTAYMLRKQPLEVWTAGEIARQPDLSQHELIARSADIRLQSYAWLFKTRNIRAQRRHLRIKIERDAFARMTADWRKFGYPFQALVASYATAIGSSSDRPAALADLMGILVNDGVRRPEVVVKQLKMAVGTPYHTVFERVRSPGERVLSVIAAKTLRSVLAQVVDRGTARRLSGVYRDSSGFRVAVGGKTGSGDNRVKKFDRNGQVLSARVVNRTATFVFYMGERFFGVITAFVPGADAEDFSFTSSLPVAMLKQLAPVINPRINLRQYVEGAEYDTRPEISQL